MIRVSVSNRGAGAGIPGFFYLGRVYSRIRSPAYAYCDMPKLSLGEGQMHRLYRRARYMPNVQGKRGMFDLLPHWDDTLPDLQRPRSDRVQ